MKQLATVTLIVAHNPLNAQERWDPASTVELITDLLEETSTSSPAAHRRRSSSGSRTLTSTAIGAPSTGSWSTWSCR